jgi:hypothetical protein
VKLTKLNSIEQDILYFWHLGIIFWFPLRQPRILKMIGWILLLTVKTVAGTYLNSITQDDTMLSKFLTRHPLFECIMYCVLGGWGLELCLCCETDKIVSFASWNKCDVICLYLLNNLLILLFSIVPHKDTICLKWRAIDFEDDKSVDKKQKII